MQQSVTAHLQSAGELVDLALQLHLVGFGSIQLLQTVLQSLASCLQLMLHQQSIRSAQPCMLLTPGVFVMTAFNPWLC